MLTTRSHRGPAVGGKTFLIHGAGGAVGAFAAQFAKWKGSRVIATASRASLPYLERLGLDAVVDYKREPFEERAVAGVDVVIDPIGGETQKRSWSVLRRGGMLINLIGEIDHAEARRVGARGVDFGMRYDTRDLEQVVRLVDRKVVKPRVARVLPLAQARRALDINQSGRSYGKIVLTVT